MFKKIIKRLFFHFQWIIIIAKDVIVLKKILIVVAFLGFIFFEAYRVNASENVLVNFIFNERSYQENDEMSLSIKVNDPFLINEVKLAINLSGPMLSVMDIEENIITLNERVDIINTSLNNNILKINFVINQNVELDNSLIKINFKVNNPIEDIYDLFVNNIAIDYGYQLYLFDEVDMIISHEVKKSSEIKVSWDVEKYVMEVFSAEPNYLDDIVIKNREVTDYELIIETNIDPTLVGQQIKTFQIIDKTNNDYFIISKIVEVVDSSPPDILAPEEIFIDDNKLGSLDFKNFFEVSDNYDKDSQISYLFFDEQKAPLTTFEEMIKFLESHKTSFLKILARDMFNNESSTNYISLIINDVTPPKISIYNEYLLSDCDIENFDFEKIINVTDNYDKNPKLVYNVTNANGDEVENYKENLLENFLLFKYFAIDDSFNQSEVINMKLKTTDVTPPVVSGVSDIIINDVMLKDFSFTEGIVVTDKIDLNPSLLLSYYLIVNDEPQEVQLVDYNKFIEQLLCGKKGYIEYRAKDAAGNISYKNNRNIIINDTTPPSIKFLNITNKGKYIKIDKIDYEILDKMSDKLDISIFLNGKEYTGEEIMVQGEYELKIIAIDEEQNKRIETISFSIIPNNIIGCGDDLYCYIHNYLEVCIAAFVLIFLVFFIIVLKLIRLKKQRNIKQKRL